MSKVAKYHVFGKTYDRFDTSKFNLTVTRDQLQAVQDLRDDEDALDEYLMNVEGWTLGRVLAGTIDKYNNFDLEALLKGEAQFIGDEDYTAGIAETLSEAKLKFVDEED